MNNFILVIIALAMILFCEFMRTTLLFNRIEDVECYCRNLMSICKILRDKNNELRARVAKLEKGEQDG